MNFARNIAGMALLVATVSLVGCSVFRGSHSSSGCNQCCAEKGHCEACSSGDYCGGDHPKRGSDAWWAIQAQSPVGARQVCKKGKLWPPVPRPTGEKQQFCHRYHAAHYWPWPYICQDRAYVNNVTDLQVSKGWMKKTTLFDHHFNVDSHELNHAGREHLLWILEEAPPERRSVYVQKKADQGVNDVRMGNVKSTMIELAGHQCASVPVSLRSGRYYGRPAVEIDTIRKAELGSMPEPRINYKTPDLDTQ